MTKFFRNFLRFMTSLLPLVFLSAVTFTVVGCSSLFYFPSQQRFYSPSRIQLKEEDIFFKSSEGDSIHAWWFAAMNLKPQEKAKGTVVFFHGNAENLSTHFLMLSWLPAQGYNYLIFDYPGYGLSSGQPNQANTVASGVAAIEWVHQNKDKSPLIIYGQSLGGAIALRSAELVRSRLPLKSIVIESGFASYRGIGRQVLRRSWVTWLLQPLTYILVSDKGAVQDVAGFSPIPMLFVHGDADNIVELESSKDLYERAKEPKELWTIPSGRHGDMYFIENGKYRRQLLDRLEKIPKGDN